MEIVTVLSENEFKYFAHLNDQANDINLVPKMGQIKRTAASISDLYDLLPALI
jgi:hypothetical protein